MDYMIIRVKEKESGKKNKKNRKGERARERKKKKASDLDFRLKRFKGIGEVACLITILQWR